MQKQFPIQPIAALVGLAELIALLGCTEKKPASTARVEPVSADAMGNPPAVTAAHTDDLPRVGGVAGYAGSQACRECHEEEYASWHGSYHRTMTQFAARDSVQADFHNVTLTNKNIRFVLGQTNAEFWVHMEHLAATAPDASSPGSVDARIGLITGSHHMQVFWVPNGMGNCQVGFPFTWLIPERRWVPRNSTFLRPPEIDLRPEAWNFVCARCHATASQPNLDHATQTWHTQVADLGISCEACHGPGDRHAAQERALSAQGDSATRTNFAIVHPKKIPPVRSAQICGFCHSMKWWEPRDGWPERGFSFRPGDDLEATTPIMRPKELERQPWLKKALEKNPGIFSDFFWPDGMIRVSGRDYNGLIESPCYRSGRFSCLSCHSMHKSEPDAQLARDRADDRGCTQCHEAFLSDSKVAAHTHHAAQSSGSQCYNCHMPRTTYGVLKAIRSHQVSSPKLADQLATGRPNACNLCHLDKTLAWTADQLARFYGHSMPKLSSDETEISEAVRLALSGDAGQRALLAWHFSWEPALQASGKSWIPPVLAQLLDDPYAAVRCLAERSLRQVAANLVPPGYDYTVAPETRPSARDFVIGQWNQRAIKVPDQSVPKPTLVRQEDSKAMREIFERLIRQRDNRPVRLRE